MRKYFHFVSPKKESSNIMWAEFAFQIFDIVVSVVSYIFIIYTILF